MDASRCVVIEFGGASQETLLKYLSKNYDGYNWIVTAFSEVRVCIWWTKNVEFSTTPLRSYLKRFKNKMPVDSYFKISRKMSTQEGIRKVYGKNGPAILTLDALQRSCIYHLTSPVREHVVGLQLQEPNNEELKEEPTNEEPLIVDDPPMFDKDREFKLDISNKVDLLLKFTARITTEVKKISKLIEDMSEDMLKIWKDEAMEDTPTVKDEPVKHPLHSFMDEPAPPKPAPNPTSFNISKLYCNRDPITGECDGDPRGHFHPF